MGELRAIIIDDEKPSREVIRNYLRDYCSEVEVIATASSVRTGFRAIQKQKPDVIFLDIEMPDGKGFDLLAMFEKIDFSVIFVTAYSEYAIKAFRVNAVDYLLKPVKIEELKDAVEKVRKTDRTDGFYPEGISSLLKNLGGTSALQPTIVVPDLKGYEVLKINEIIMCKADGYCTNFYLQGNRKVISSRNLKQYEAILSDHSFMRVHHSYIVNLNHVINFTRQGEISLTGEIKAFLGDRFRNQFVRIINRNK